MNGDSHNYYVYILTNKTKTVLYTGVTSDLSRRLYDHSNSTNANSFTFRYQAFYLLYFERFQFINHAIEREKEIKGWRRSKKIDLINKVNPDWTFLNDTIS